MICSRCQAPFGAGAKFCAQCGAKVPERVTGPLMAEGDRRVVTVLFTDVSGFTSLSERLDPEAVTGLMNDLFAVLTEPIYRYGGVVDKYIGDALMATFGAPVAREDDPERAVWAAWDMLRAADAFAETLEARLGLRLGLRIGVNTGLVVAGAVGGQEKREYTVLGETVNLAQRMEACAPVGSVLVTDETYRLTCHAFRFAERPSVSMPGRTQPVACHALLGPAEVSLELADAFIGRAAERARLEEAWNRVLAGRPQAVLVQGEAGVGKTTLLKQVFRSKLPEGAIRWAKCRPNEFAVSLDLVSTLLRALLGLGPHRADHASVARAIQEVVVRYALPEEAQDTFGFLMTGQEATFFAGLAPEYRKALIFRHLNALAIAMAHERPMVIVVEDLQWVDEASAEWILFLLQAMKRSPAPILLVMTARPGERILPIRGAALPVQEVAVGPLGAAESVELIQRYMERAGSVALPEAILGQLSKRAGGNPRFLVALAAAFSNETSAGHLQARTLPVSIMGYLLARLDGLALSPTAHHLLEAAAVLGAQATLDRLRRLAPEPAAPAEFAALAEQRLLEPDGDGLSFRNPLMQDAVYERILLKRRRELHSQAADMLEQEALHPAVVAEHYVRAERPGPAARCLLLAAERSLAHFSNQEALQLVEKAREWLSRCAPDEVPADAVKRLLGVEAAAQAALGDFETAIATSAKLMGLATPDELPRCYRLHSGLLRRMGKLSEALDTCVKGLSLVQHSRELLLTEYADALQMKGENQAALDTANAVLVTEGLDVQVRGHLLGVAGLSCYRMRRLEEAHRLLHAAVDACRGSGDLYSMTNALNNLGSVCDVLGRLSEAEDCYQQGAQVAERIGDLRLQSMLLNNLSILSYRKGDYAGAAVGFGRALEMHQDMHDQHGEGIALCNLGETCMRLGEDERAETYLFQSIMVLEAIHSKGMAGEAYRQLTALKLKQARFEMALSLGLRTLTLAEETSQPELQGAALLMVSRANVGLGRLEEGLARAMQAVQVLRALGGSLELANALMHLGRTLSAMGLPAAETFTEASRCYRELGAEPEATEADLLAAALPHA